LHFPSECAILGDNTSYCYLAKQSDLIVLLRSTGPESSVIEKYEYDIIASSEEKKAIILADAKYRDMAPSKIKPCLP
jgi:hypothetical protein